jgi:hypothetical protein
VPPPTGARWSQSGPEARDSRLCQVFSVSASSPASVLPTSSRVVSASISRLVFISRCLSSLSLASSDRCSASSPRSCSFSRSCSALRISGASVKGPPFKKGLSVPSKTERSAKALFYTQCSRRLCPEVEKTAVRTFGPVSSRTVPLEATIPRSAGRSTTTGEAEPTNPEVTLARSAWPPTSVGVRARHRSGAISVAGRTTDKSTGSERR